MQQRIGIEHTAHDQEWGFKSSSVPVVKGYQSMAPFPAAAVLFAANRRPLWEMANGPADPPHLSVKAEAQSGPAHCCFCTSLFLHSSCQKNTLMSHPWVSLRLFDFWRKGFTITTMRLQPDINLWIFSTDRTRICVHFNLIKSNVVLLADPWVTSPGLNKQ